MPEELAKHYTCGGCGLTDKDVDCSGIYFCPNPFCRAFGEIKRDTHVVVRLPANVRSFKDSASFLLRCSLDRDQKNYRDGTYDFYSINPEFKTFLSKIINANDKLKLAGREDFMWVEIEFAHYDEHVIVALRKARPDDPRRLG